MLAFVSELSETDFARPRGGCVCVSDIIESGGESKL